MRTLSLAALLALATGTAHALPDVKTLAQFDIGYAKCESRYAHMKGHGDDAYLSLWKVRPDAKQRAELARQRKTAAYRQARGEAAKKMAQGSGRALDDKIALQCQGTWAELQRNRPPQATGVVTKPAASAALPAK